MREPGLWTRMLDRMDDTLLLIAISLVFCIIRTIIQPSTRTVRSYLGMFVVSIPTGLLAGYIARDYDLSDSGVMFATALASLLSQNIVEGLLDNSLMRRLLEGAIQKYTGINVKGDQ